MTVNVTKKDGSMFVHKDVWEIEDTGKFEIIIKFHNHECIRYSKGSVKKLETKI